MIQIILQATFIWAICLGIYTFLLKKNSFHQLNRLFLLSGLSAGAILPLIDLPSSPNAVSTVWLPAVEQVNRATTVYTNELSGDHFFLDILLIIYLTGASILLARFFLGNWKLFHLRRRAEIVCDKGMTLAYTQSLHTPFSYLGTIYLSKQMDLSDVDVARIIDHEKVHVEQWHSLDIILTEMIKIVFWPSPIIHFFKTNLQHLHEFLADRGATTDQDYRSYADILCRMIDINKTYRLSSSFGNISIKR